VSWRKLGRSGYGRDSRNRAGFRAPGRGWLPRLCPDLPGLHTQGDDLDDAMANANEAVPLNVEGLGEDGETLDSGVIRRTVDGWVGH